MTILDQVRAHALPEKSRIIEVPEWGTSEAPLLIHYRMVTLDDMALVNELDGSQWHKQAARIVVLKASDLEGNKLFKMTDALVLRAEAAPDVVNRIALAMLGRLSVEQAEKN